MTKCNPHPDAPHGFDRNGSHNADRYVCDCEGWQPPTPIDEMIVKAYHGDNGDAAGWFEFTPDEMAEITNELNRLREIEWMYKELCE